MEDRIQGRFGEHIARVKFNEPAENLQIRRTVSTFSVEIPITIEFGTRPDQLMHLQPCLNYLWGDVYVAVESNNNRCIGRIDQLDFKHEYRRGNGSVVSKIVWSGNLAELSFFERVRNGSRPKINFSAHGELCYLAEQETHGMPEMRSASYPFWLSAHIEFSKEIWVDRLRKIDCLENILLEIPLPTSPPNPWDEVWAALVDARNAFEHGGATAWKNCIVSIRLGLEKWRAIEKEDFGTGGHDPTSQERQSRTKAQRLDNIRFHLLHYAHFSAHTHADQWTRDDAVLMISTLSALLSIRKP